MAALLGMIAPPISIPAMIICAGVDIPYVGFALPLLICTAPLALVYALTMIYPTIRKCSDTAALEAQLEKMEREKLSFRLALPVIVLVVLFAVEQIFASVWPGLGMPLIFLIAAAAGFLTGVKWDFVETVTEAVNDCLPVLGILMGVGMFIQIMTLIGVQGFIVVSTLSLPSWTIFLGIAVIIPLFGAVSSFGASSVLGVPCLLAMLSRDSVVVASALSLVAALGDLMPPTALAGIFAAQVVDEPNYFKILKKCLLPALVLDVWGILVIIYSNNVAALIK